VLRTISDPDFLAAVRAKGEWLRTRLNRLAAGTSRVREARGRGLMWGLELNELAAPVVAAARERHLLVLTAGPTVIRIVPPLTITREELERGVTILRGARVTGLSIKPRRAPQPETTLRPATLADVAAMEALMAPFVVTGDLLPRSNYDLCRHIKEYVVALAPDGTIVGTGVSRSTARSSRRSPASPCVTTSRGAGWAKR